MQKVLVSLSLLAITACAHVSVVRYDFSPAGPSKRVAVLHSAPDRDYIQVASMSAPANQRGMNGMIDRAKELGCDAVILTGTRESGAVIGQSFGLVNVEATFKMTGIAIRYR